MNFYENQLKIIKLTKYVLTLYYVFSILYGKTILFIKKQLKFAENQLKIIKLTKYVSTL